MSSERKALFICQQCGTEFEGWIYRKPKFCSLQCAGKSFVKPKPQVPCPICGKLFIPRRRGEYLQKWCSKQCAGKTRINSPITFICEHCKEPFVLTGQEIIDFRKRGRQFCSQECHYAHHIGENHPGYNGGRFPDYGPNWPRQRNLARKRDNYKCQVCNITENEQGEEMSVHHIEPRSVFNGNWKRANALSNLISLCRCCHKLVEEGSITI